MVDSEVAVSIFPRLSNHPWNTISPSMELPTGHCQEHYQPGMCIISGSFTGESDAATLPKYISFPLFARLLLNHLKMLLSKRLLEFWVWVVESIDTFGLKWCKVHVESCPYPPVPIEPTNPFKPLTHTHGNLYPYLWVWVWVGMGPCWPQGTWGLPMRITSPWERKERRLQSSQSWPFCLNSAGDCVDPYELLRLNTIFQEAEAAAGVGICDWCEHAWCIACTFPFLGFSLCHLHSKYMFHISIILTYI